MMEHKRGDFTFRTVFDCKCYGRKVNVKDVESFLGMLDDLRVSKGVIVTTKGFTKTALKRAQREPRDIDLQILPPERLSEFQGNSAIVVWNGPVLAIIAHLEGWIIDDERSGEEGWCLFSMYPLGHTLESAMKHSAFIYGNIVLKSEKLPTMEAIAQDHERIAREKFPEARFERLAPLDPEQQPPTTLLRVGHVPIHDGPEYSLYIDNPKGVLLLVMLCFEWQQDMCIPALKWIGGHSVLGHRVDDQTGFPAKFEASIAVRPRVDDESAH